jgi:predicted nucleotidyltransferase
LKRREQENKVPFLLIKDKKHGLLKSDINEVVSILKKNQKINKVVLFGSRAKGVFSAGSDVDIALQGDNLVLNDILNVSIELENLYLPYKFDLIIYDRIKEKDIVEHIDRVGKVLYDKRNIGTE